VRDLLLLVDVVNSFRHQGGEQLAESFTRRQPALRRLIDSARRTSTPIVYANDNWGVWDSDVRSLVADAVENGIAGNVVATIAPRPGDRFVVKPRYSAFRETPLALILDQLDAERIVLAGTATEMCVTQTAIDARESGYKVSVVAEACATVDEADEALALSYLTRIVEVQVERADDVFASVREEQALLGTGVRK
jgi:nicotinamidase-related amidase